MNSREEQLLQRITQLESMYMHLQQDYDALNETVLMNANKLDRITAQLSEMISKIPDSMNGAEVRSLEDEKPPHY